MKIRSSWKVAAVGVLSLAAVFSAWSIYSEQRLKNFTLTEIKPGRVNLIAIKPGQGYRILIVNRVASLAETEGGGLGPGDPSASSMRRIRIREMLGALQGNEKDLGILIEWMNRLDPSELPPEELQWEQEDLMKALSGEDPDLQDRLEQMLNVTVEGVPLHTINTDAIYYGIGIKSSVPVEVNIAGEPTTLYGKVRQPFQASFAKRFEAELDKKFEYSQEAIVGMYQEAARPIWDNPTSGQNIQRAINDHFSENRLKNLAEQPERILKSAKVILTEDHIVSVKKDSHTEGKKTFYNITMELTEEGRMRLWKYSHEIMKQNWLARYLGQKSQSWFQVMFIVDGVAVQAPIFRSELAEKTIRITRLQDETVAEDAVEKIREHTQQS
jgi:hypothetical protein